MIPMNAPGRFPQQDAFAAHDEALDAADLCWPVLLNQWIGLAKSAVALGADEQSQALRKLVPDIIMMQAVAFALMDLHRLELPEQKLGCLRAQWLIDRHEEVIRSHWPKDEPLPEKLEELITQARDAYAFACKHISDHECTADQPDHKTQADPSDN